MNLIKTNSLVLFCMIFLFGTPLVFAQKELKRSIEENQNRDQIKRDSIFQLIQITKNDTLLADLYFTYFELNNEPEIWMTYSKAIIKKIDSTLLINKPSDLHRRALLNRKAMAYRYMYFSMRQEDLNREKTIQTLDQALTIYKETKNDAEAAQVFVDMADNYFKQGKLLDQLQVLQEGLKYETERQFVKGIARFYVQLQLFYADIGDTAQALSYVEKGIALSKTIADPTREARGYYLAGLTYSRMMKHQKAIEYLLKSIESYKKKNMAQKDRIYQTYERLGDEYMKIKEYDKALLVYEELIEVGTKANDLRSIFIGTMGKGTATSHKGNHQEALEIHLNILKLAEGAGADDGTISLIKQAIAEDYYRAGDYVNARKNIEKSIQLHDGVVIDHYNKELLAHKIDSASNFHEGAYKHYHQMQILKEQLNKQDVARSAARDKFLSELNEVKSEQEKLNTIHDEEKKKQQIITYSVISGLILIALFALFVVLSLNKSRRANKIISAQKQEVESQKHLVEEKQKEITDSITYAKRLQEAILPPNEFVNANLASNFIYYQPKDIVAGDFYWAEKVNDLFFIAAADSTGHGVPGALVSVVCSNALNRTLKEFKLTETGKILDKTRELVLETFEKSTSEVKDGMDISLLCIDSKNKKVFWSGANNPLWYIQNNELKEIKADKQPIGKTDHAKPFTTHEITYQEQTTFYLFTDGFADQFGGPNGKKFKYKQFSDLLVKNNNLTQEEQADILHQAFTNWKGELEQVDDVCVIGIKI